MSKKPDFTFLDVGIPKGEILKPKFPKGKPVIWKDKNVTKVIVEDDKTVRCNDEFVLFSELTKDIMDSQGSNTKTGVQSSSRWTWKGKQLDVLHSTVYTSRKLVTLLNNDFNQALPMYDTAPYDTQPKMLALAICFGVTAAMFAEKPQSDTTKAQFFVAHILNLILGEVHTLAHESPTVFKSVFDEYSQALKSGDIDCTRRPS